MPKIKKLEEPGKTTGSTLYVAVTHGYYQDGSAGTFSGASVASEQNARDNLRADAASSGATLFPGPVRVYEITED